MIGGEIGEIGIVARGERENVARRAKGIGAEKEETGREKETSPNGMGGPG